MTAIQERDTSAVPDRARSPRRRTVVIVELLLASALVVLIVVCGWRLRAAHELDADRAEALATGKRAVGTMLTYDYRTLDADVDAARAGMTSSYRRAYDDIATQQVRPDAAQKQTVNTAQVAQAAVVDARRGSVTLLLFVNTTFEQKGEDPVVGVGRLRVTMQEAGGRWLIDQVTLL